MKIYPNYNKQGKDSKTRHIDGDDDDATTISTDT